MSYTYQIRAKLANKQWWVYLNSRMSKVKVFRISLEAIKYALGKLLPQKVEYFVANITSFYALCCFMPHGPFTYLIICNMLSLDVKILTP